LQYQFEFFNKIELATYQCNNISNKNTSQRRKNLVTIAPSTNKTFVRS